MIIVIYFKEYESSESRIPALRVEFDKERAAMESHITSLRRQVCFACLFVCLFVCLFSEGLERLLLFLIYPPTYQIRPRRKGAGWQYTLNKVP